jgi:hypothetical protein
LQREVGVIAERGHFDACALAGFNEQRARGSGKFPAVDSEIHISHANFAIGRSSDLAIEKPASGFDFQSQNHPITQ